MGTMEKRASCAFARQKQLRRRNSGRGEGNDCLRLFADTSAGDLISSQTNTHIHVTVWREAIHLALTRVVARTHATYAHSTCTHFLSDVESL